MLLDINEDMDIIDQYIENNSDLINEYNKINVTLILELQAANMFRNGIAATRHMSKNLVGDVFHITDQGHHL